MKTTASIDAARLELLLTELRLPAVKLMWKKLAARRHAVMGAQFLVAPRQVVLGVAIEVTERRPTGCRCGAVPAPRPAPTTRSAGLRRAPRSSRRRAPHGHAQSPVGTAA